MTQPTPVTPIDATGADVADRLGARVVEVPPALLERLSASGAEVVHDDDARAEAGRDWWPLAIGWAAEGAVPQRPAVVVRPTSTEQVSAVLAACNEAAVPVTAAAGRSGVCGGSIPVHGGVALDMTALDGLRAVDETSLRADVRAGTFGPDLETALGEVGAGYTLGHWPQSMDLSTVGGWLACRGAGQYSTRYGKIEDMVVGLEVVLADGRVVHTEGKGPRAATGSEPDPALRRQRGDARRHHRGPPPHPPLAGGPRTQSLRVLDLRRRPGGLPSDFAPGGDAGGPAPLRPDGVRAELRRGRDQCPHRPRRG